MSWWRFARREKWDAERQREIDAYLRIETDENIARGMTPGEARVAAQRRLGNTSLVREEIYRMNTLTLLDSLVRNVRYTLRALGRNPLFATIAVLTVGIGIGANTAIFSVVNAVLLKPLPYRHSEELVAIWQTAPGAGLAGIAGDLRMSGSMYFTYAENNRSFQTFGAWVADRASVTGLAEPEQVRVIAATDGTLQTLGISPEVGRSLGPGDQAVGAPATVLLSHAYWQRRFGGDRSVIGRRLTVESLPREIVGVMPAGFRIGNADAELILPARLDRSRLILAGFGFQGVARLKPGVTITQANADLARMLPIWMASWSNGPGTNSRVYESWRIAPRLRPLKQDVVGDVGGVLWVLMGTIGMVMLIACANVANLLLVRADGRQQELAVRAAMGAGWGRIVRDLLSESITLGLLGGLVGLGLAFAGLRFLIYLSPANLPRLSEISIDWRTLVFNFAIAGLSGLLFGLVPAWKYAGPRISSALRAGGRTSSQSRERHRARNTLVVVQVALALVLLVSSGLMIRTFQAIRRVQPGFTQAEQVQTARIAIPQLLEPDAERVERMQNAILDKVAAIPGVVSVGFSSSLPLEGLDTWWDSINVQDQPTAPGQTRPMRRYKYLSPGLLNTTGTGLAAGREISWEEIYGRRPVAMVSENLARELWGAPAAALGKQIRGGIDAEWREVIGVVRDIRDNGMQEPPPTIVYWPPLSKNLARRNAPDQVARAVTIAIRSKRAGTESLANEVRRAIWAVNPSLPVATVRTLQEVYDQSMARTSFTLVMLAIAGAMALLLGVIGIYGVISYAVSQRSREVGIRLALGAGKAQLKGMFVREGLALAGVGVAVGLVVAAGLMNLMKSLLFEISPLDPVTYAAVPLVLVMAAVAASYLPARRAAALDPVEALKGD